jgi:putative transposase
VALRTICCIGSLSEYGRTAGAVHTIGWHLVWCPKYRKKVLVGDVAVRLVEVLRAKATEREWEILAVEVMADHVHLFVRTPPSVSPARLDQLKGSAAHALRSEFAHLRSRLPTPWSKSYFVASVGRVSEVTIRLYIDEQTTSPRQERKR